MTTVKERETVSVQERVEDKQIFVLMGASGSGKSTVGGWLKAKGLSEIISHTTRPMRVGEEEGVTYYYVTKEEFDQIEKVEQVEYQGNHYCISKKEIDEKLSRYDQLFVLTDVHGMEQVKASYPKEVIVIYLYISLEEMEERMRDRGDSEENIQKRLEYARLTNELDNGKFADYQIENKILSDTLKEVESVINRGA